MPATPLFRRIDVAPAYQKVADAIEREIVNGRIKPGEPIGTEQELVRQFGVNRSTVREGIRVFEEGGLISAIPAAGSTPACRATPSSPPG